MADPQRSVAGALAGAVETLLAGPRARPEYYATVLEHAPRAHFGDELCRLERAFARWLGHRAEIGIPREHLEVAAFLLARAPWAVIDAAVSVRRELLQEPAFQEELTALVVRYVTRPQDSRPEP